MREMGGNGEVFERSGDDETIASRRFAAFGTVVM
jgi:hypothetical protein